MWRIEQETAPFPELRQVVIREQAIGINRAKAAFYEGQCFEPPVIVKIFELDEIQEEFRLLESKQQVGEIATEQTA